MNQMAAIANRAIQVDGDKNVPFAPMSQASIGHQGMPVRLLSNHFDVKFGLRDCVLHQYTVTIKSEDDKMVEGKNICRKIIDKLLQTYNSELEGKDFAYDGSNTLFTVGPLPQNNFEFAVTLDETSLRSVSERMELTSHSQVYKKQLHIPANFKVAISYAKNIPLQSIATALQVGESEIAQDALRVLNTILRQRQAKRGCLLVGQAFFSDDTWNKYDLTGGASGCGGLHSCFHITAAGLSLNIDVSTTMIVTPGSVIKFLLEAQNVGGIKDIDWHMAKKTLKKLRVKAKHNNREYTIFGLSDQPCSTQTEVEIVNITVQDYFKDKKVELTRPYLQCLDVGKPSRPNYLPIELCDIVPLQRYTKPLSTVQRTALAEVSCQKPQQQMQAVMNAVHSDKYDDPMLSSCGLEIKKHLACIDGRILGAPVLAVGNGKDCIPMKGRWNYNDKMFLAPVTIELWAVVNFSSNCDLKRISGELINCGRRKGILMKQPHALVSEDSQYRRCSPFERVERMFEKVKANFHEKPEFLLCVLPERKNCDIYGPWKKKNLHEMGIATQCIAPWTNINDQYLTNILLKINAKLGGVNSKLALEHQIVPNISEVPTLIIGMDVSHGPPGQSQIPSVVTVVGSIYWPQISRYKAYFRAQSPKMEMIDSLFKEQSSGNREGIMSELLRDFYKTSQHRMPGQIIVFRDGVSESQFNQVLNIELKQLKKACEKMGMEDLPKFTVIIAQKKHHTKFFQMDSQENIPPGTVVDSGIVHPRHNDFYMCAHAGLIGTSRPIHYHVLADEIGFCADDLQKLVLSLSYVLQRSTIGTSIVAPIHYAHLAAAQVGQFMKSEESKKGSCGNGVPPLHPNLCDSMFFC